MADKANWLDYQRALWKRAVAETKAGIGDPNHAIMRAVLLSVAVIAFNFALLGWDAMMNAAFTVFLSVIAANLVVFGLYALLQRARAGFLVYRDDQAAIAAANRSVLNQQLAERLGKLDDWAVHHLWARHPQTSTDPAFPLWVRRITLWKGRVLGALRKNNCPFLDYRSVKVLGNLAGEPNYNGDPLVNHQMRMLAIRRKRIEVLIKKYRID